MTIHQMMMLPDDRFDWMAALEQCQKEPEAAADCHKALVLMASDWPTCACGQLCKAVPRYMNGRPKDYELYELGIDFADQVGNHLWSDALATLHKIEARTVNVLQLQPIV
jgi:hypothetical protein